MQRTLVLLLESSMMLVSSSRRLLVEGVYFDLATQSASAIPVVHRDSK